MVNVWYELWSIKNAFMLILYLLLAACIHVLIKTVDAKLSFMKPNNDLAFGLDII